MVLAANPQSLLGCSLRRHVADGRQSAVVKVRSGLSQFQFSFVASDLYESCAELRFPTKASEI